jgi:hypothetical protein
MLTDNLGKADRFQHHLVGCVIFGKRSKVPLGNPCEGEQVIYSLCKATRTASGFFDAIRNNALAGPTGFLLPCSQFCKVRTLTPTIYANSFCETLSFFRTFLISGG